MTQSDEGIKTVQYKAESAMLAISQNIKLKNAQIRETYQSSIRKGDIHIVKEK